MAGVGSDAWNRLFAGPRPAELHRFTEIHGDTHHAVSTPGDLLFHIRAAQHDVRFELASLIMDRLAGAARVVDGLFFVPTADFLDDPPPAPG